MLITRLDAHHKLFISLFTALITFFVSAGKISVSTQFIIVWTGFALTLTGLSWSTILSVHPIEMKKIAKVQDSNRHIIFLFILTAAMVCFFVVIILLRSTQQLKGTALTLHILLSVAAVISSWTMVHTLFVFRYAHMYYGDAPKGKLSAKGKAGASGSKEDKPSKYIEGLEFPNEPEPDYLDFTYFSFVIGMTFQVSDVVIESKSIRRLALLHSLVSFAFNTVIVALSINVISGLMSK